MIIKETARSTYLDVARIAWEPSPYPGVENKVLYEDPSGRRTVLTRLTPGARLPSHRHVGIEQSFVLTGTLVDEDGACTAGNFVWRRAGSVHEAWSPDGCLVLGIFEAPNEFLRSPEGASTAPSGTAPGTSCGGKPPLEVEHQAVSGRDGAER